MSLSRFAYEGNSAEGRIELQKIRDTASLAARAEFPLFAGQGLDYVNARMLPRDGSIREFVSGQALVSRGLLVNLGEAVRQMLAVLREGA